MLAAFGRAYGVLPEQTGDLTPDQNTFLDQSVQGLAQDGKVISVRLALFAEMVKGKPWTPATLREVGGTEGVGVTFLEETFSGTTAPPEHRLHQKAAQAVLKALLPESGTDIKGQMRSAEELRDASGYADRPRDFDDLLRILDPELRLITPTDPEGAAGEGTPAHGGGRYYQLTHDYLVHSLRDWLTRKQRETRRGRAELRLAERPRSGKQSPRTVTSRPPWNGPTSGSDPPQGLDRLPVPDDGAGRSDSRPPGIRARLRRRLDDGRRALVRNQYDESNRRTTAAGLVQQLLSADTRQVPGIIKGLGHYRRWTDPELKQAMSDASCRPAHRLHASLALLPVDGGQVAFLEARMLDANPADLAVVRDALEPHRAELTPKLWAVLDAAKAGDPRLLPAAGALADYEPENPRWNDLGGKVAQALVTVNPVFLGEWLDALRPVRGKLTAPLAADLPRREPP